MKSGTTSRKAIAKKSAAAAGPSAAWASAFQLAVRKTEQDLLTIHTARGGAENESSEGSMKDGAGQGGVDAAKRDVDAEDGWVDEGDSEDDSTAVLVGRRSVRNGAVDVQGMWKSFQEARHAQIREKQAEQERARSVQEQMKAEQARAVESAAEAEARKKQEREAQRAADRARREAERMGSGIDLMGQANLMKSFEAGASGGGADDLSFDSFG